MKLINIREIEKPLDSKYILNEAEKRVRKMMADEYRQMRKSNPAATRIFWKINKEIERQINNAIMYGYTSHPEIFK